MDSKLYTDARRSCNCPECSRLAESINRVRERNLQIAREAEKRQGLRLCPLATKVRDAVSN